MNEINRDPLLEELSSLTEDVPPMPEELHASWMQLVEEDAMTKPETKPAHRMSKMWMRALSAAAALLLVVGGTVMTKDMLNPTAATKSSDTQTMNNAKRAAGGDAFGMTNSSYMAMEDDGAVMMDMDAAAEMDSMDVSEARETKIIRSASMTISTKQYDDAAAELRGLCQTSGGWVSSFSESSNSSGLRTGWFTFRVPSDRLDDFLAGTGDAGVVVNRSESAYDVTDSYYDTAGRLASKRQLLDRLLALSEQAGDLSELMELETKIADVQYDIDRLQGSLNSTDQQVNYATVDITLREAAPEEAMQVREASLGERMMNALAAGWGALTEFLTDMMVFLVAALPFLIVVGAVIAVIVVIRRKRRK